MSDWKTYKLSELVEIKYGKDHKHLADGKIPLYGSGGIMRYVDTPLYEQESILIPRKGTLSNLFYLNIPFWSVDTMFYTKIKAGNNGKYLYYLLKSMDLASMNVGSAVPSLTTEVLNKVEINVPDEETQTQIAQILTSLDDKIELNHEMNQTLEAMAQALFKEWFVNFNFPNFDGVLENGLPKGWRMGSVLEIAILLSGGTPKTDTEEYWNGSINWISAKDITSNNNQFIIETEKTITELGIKKSAAKLLPKFTTIISARGTVGNYCILSKEMAISQSNYGLKSNSNNDYFLFLMVENMILMMKAFSYGTVFDTITTKTFQEMEVIIPDEKVIRDFEKVVTPLYEKILTNQFQIQSLTQTRDTLLPKLMSGKLEIR
ncbi:MAG: restriction endonuclease subunit S [Saprospiraceae bacterium]|nr:restriction endonuclease subunit S [Saprospiraceae bacterium]